jgi:hypothetical protein
MAIPMGHMNNGAPHINFGAMEQEPGIRRVADASPMRAHAPGYPYDHGY